jgi:hypothetical protein
MIATIRATLADNTRRMHDALGGGHALVNASREVADRAVAGEIGFRHLGVRYFSVGRNDIDWSGPQHKHQEWEAQLNRFFHLPSLAAAYQETRDERYAEAARDYLVEWVHAHPVRGGWAPAHYDNTLNLSIRMMQWARVLSVFLPSPAFTDDVVEAIIASVTVQLDYLMAHLTPVANWRIAQADSLLYVGILFAALPASAAWRDVGVRVLNDAFHRQVLPDGAHLERTPGYHHWMTNVFTNYWRVGQAMPALGLCMDAETLARMYDYNVGTCLPNGSGNGLHDSNSHLAGMDAIQLDLRAAFRREAGLPDTLPSTAQYFQSAGQIFLRESWTPESACLTFDATNWGGAHCHLSRNAIQLYAHGRLLLLDPGTLTYEMSDPLMASGKATRAHNTLNLNGWNQAFTDPAGTRHVSAPGYDLVSSVYNAGYWPGVYRWSFPGGFGAGIYADHFRAMLWLRGRAVVVFDNLQRSACPDTPTLESNWQLPPGPVAVDGRRAVTQHPDANLLLDCALAPAGLALTVHEGESDPPRGWLQGDGAYLTAPQLCLSGPMPWPGTQLITVLVPFASPEPPAVGIAAAEEEDGLQTLRLDWPDGSRDLIVATPRLATAIGPRSDVATDAALAVIHTAPDGAVSGLAVDATYLEPYAPARRRGLGTWGF